MYRVIRLTNLAERLASGGLKRIGTMSPEFASYVIGKQLFHSALSMGYERGEPKRHVSHHV
jgi:hypothetical protein